MSLKYVKKSLFTSPKENILVHACNAQGVWGSGIAREFAERFPDAYHAYKSACGRTKKFNPDNLLAGRCHVTIQPDGIKPIIIANLITSVNYGNKKDDPATILLNTTLALEDLGKTTLQFKKRPFASNKFNSGLFSVSWEQTEKILTYFVDRYKLDWTVYTGEE